MKWFEYIIIAIAIGLVILPIILVIKNKKKSPDENCHGCTFCSMKDVCSKKDKMNDKGNN